MRGYVLGTGEEVSRPMGQNSPVRPQFPTASPTQPQNQWQQQRQIQQQQGQQQSPYILDVEEPDEYQGRIPSYFEVACKLKEWYPALGLLLLEIVLGICLYHAGNRALLILFSLNTWLIGLAFHEFGHAIVAYWSGDYTVLLKGYLTFNILNYTSLVSSIIIPLFFLLIGGIGLPGGAVFIETERLKSKWHVTAMALAGPFGSFLSGAFFAIPFAWVEPSDYDPSSKQRFFYYALAFCVFFFFVAMVLNSLIIPPLDGYGAIRMHLPDGLRSSIESPSVYPIVSIGGLLFVFLMFWRIPGALNFLLRLTESFGVPRYCLSEGMKAFKIV